MLRSLKDLEDFAIGVSDGTIGHVKDFYFDDRAWVIRYLVVDTGSWLASRKVLISPIVLGRPDWAAKLLPASISREKVKNSPDVDTEQPVSRQYEMRYFGYYGYNYYWDGAGSRAAGVLPRMMQPDSEGYVAPSPDPGQLAYARAEAARREHDDLHLRSCNVVTGYHVLASDGDIGHVQGLVVDDETWAVRYLVVDTSNWWLGHQVLVAPQWIQDLSWGDASVTVNMTRQAVQDAPPYDSAVPLDRMQELRFHEHHGRPGYWTYENEAEAGKSSR